MFKNMLVPVDGSTPSSNALDAAIDLARTYGAQLSIVHASYRVASFEALREVADRFGFLDDVAEDLSNPEVIAPVATPGAGIAVVVVPDAMLEKFGSLLLDKAAIRARAAGLETVVTGLLQEEDPAAEILRYADRNAIDLIVTGSRGLGGLKGLFLGSVSHKLIEDAKCPCLVVK